MYPNAFSVQKRVVSDWLLQLISLYFKNNMISKNKSFYDWKLEYTNKNYFKLKKKKW